MNIQLDDIVRNSRFIRESFPHILKIAYSDSLTLLSGEKGTEKIYIARLIHALSDRDQSAFVPFDCRSPLYINSKYSREDRYETKFEDSWLSLRHRVSGGSVYIGGIDFLNRREQFYLKSILEKEQGQLRRREALNLPTIRFILGCSHDLEARVRDGNFLPELYYTMMVVEIEIPPLRERRDDIIPLARLILNSSPGGIGSAFDCEAKSVLVSYDWPGNFYQLKAVLNQVLEESQDGWITGRSLIEKIGLNFHSAELTMSMS